MKIELHTSPPPGLDSFVAAHPLAAEAHRPAWPAILHDGLGHRPFLLTAQRDGQIVGYLPLALCSGFPFGRHLVSLPFLSSAGPIADEPQTLTPLLEHAIDSARSHSARRLELRLTAPLDNSSALTPARTDKIGMELSLPAHADTLWADLDAKVRNQVRKAERNGVTIRTGGPELLPIFHRLFLTNMRDLGTPAYPRRFFHAMLAHLAGDAELLLAEHQGRPAAAAILIHRPGSSFVPVASSLRELNSTCANMLLYWHMIHRAIERRSTTFDFGRSTIDSGPHRFKRQWGAAPVPLHWQHLPLHPAASAISREDSRYSLAVRLWQRLPLWAASLLGPPIARRIPA